MLFSILYNHLGSWASQVAQWLGICLPIQETWIRTLSQEDPLEEEMATHPYVLAWEILWTEEPGGLQSMGSQSWTRLSDWAHLDSWTLVCSLQKEKRMLTEKETVSKGLGCLSIFLTCGIACTGSEELLPKNSSLEKEVTKRSVLSRCL